MHPPARKSFVRTVRERCRTCYTCVRDCPARAIRIAEGQAEVLPERCIGCGNCVQVCSQHAKEVQSSIDKVKALLEGKGAVAALLAPSFPAEFFDVHFRRLVGMLRTLGFHKVVEVGFGADLVADRYARLLRENPQRRYIATTCPAIVEYVCKYHPQLLNALAPIVSPMVAMVRALRAETGSELRCVFIGPCIAKKAEVDSEELDGEIDAALTFQELRQMFDERGIWHNLAKPSDFDPPHPHLGGLFPLSRGMLQTAGIDEDLMAGEIVSADGRHGFVEAIKEFENGALDARLLETLCCNGCIMGAGMSCKTPLFRRRSRVSRYVQQRSAELDPQQWQAAMQRFRDLDLSRVFKADDQRLPRPSDEEVNAVLERMGKSRPENQLNCGACGYHTCYDHAAAISEGLAESEMCLPFTIEKLHATIQELAKSHQALAETQVALMQSEKLASMGQLAAGIAHEVNNPLGVVLMYSHLLLEEAQKHPDLKDDLSLIVEQADRCKKIVSGLLNFARQNKVLLQTVDLTELVERSLRALPIPAAVRVSVEHHLEHPEVELDSDQILQVLTNLYSNAFAAMPAGGELKIETGGSAESVTLRVRDSGCGISKENIPKLFTPFFTTKKLGKGTGLGLAVSYGIIKMHRGDIRVESNADPAQGPTWTCFTLQLPRQGRAE